MKKTILFAFALQGLLISSMSAQTEAQRKVYQKEYDFAALRAISTESSAKFKADRAKAYQIAEALGLEKTFITHDGAHAELMGLTESGKPLYFVTNNRNAAFTSGIVELNTGGSLGLDLNGQGMYTAMWDQNRPRGSHNTFGGRLAIADAAIVQSTHPTHVMGTIMGSGVGSTNDNAKGMAYQANGFAFSWDNDTAEMADAAESMGILVSNHSYGNFASNLDEYQFGSYGTQAYNYDRLAVAAPYYLIVSAAGNDRNSGFNTGKGGYDLINGTKTAKNTLVVAAVNGLTSPYTSPSDVVMSSFSSYGPTDDRRVKPDISAKGVNVYSAIDTSNSAYGSQNGTSMAAPVVSGGAMLLQQLWNDRNGTDDEYVYMRSATLRGLILHTAAEAGSGNGPDGSFGWGLFDAKAAAEAIINRGTTSIIEEKTISNTGTHAPVTITAVPGQKLQVSICWTDPTAQSTINSGVLDDTTPVLINDLDVRVVQNETTYNPWKLTDTNGDDAVRGDNIVDNFERIDIPNASGTYTIQVSKKGNLSGGSQRYSLIVTNGTISMNTADHSGQQLVVWPNPASTELNVKVGQALNNASVQLIDINGRVVRQQSMTGLEDVVSVSGLSSGVYVVKVEEASRVTTQKISIK